MKDEFTILSPYPGHALQHCFSILDSNRPGFVLNVFAPPRDPSKLKEQDRAALALIDRRSISLNIEASSSPHSPQAHSELRERLDPIRGSELFAPAEPDEPLTQLLREYALERASRGGLVSFYATPASKVPYFASPLNLELATTRLSPHQLTLKRQALAIYGQTDSISPSEAFFIRVASE